MSEKCRYKDKEPIYKAKKAEAAEKAAAAAAAVAKAAEKAEKARAKRIKKKEMEREAKEALRREKEAKKSSEANSVPFRQQSSSSDSETDYPIKTGLGPTAARKQRVGLGEEHSAKRALRNLKEELEEMSEDDIDALSQSIFSSRKAKSAKDQDSPVLKGKIYANRKTNK